MMYFDYLKSTKDLVAMVHVAALPGTPGNFLSVEAIIEKAVEEAKMYRDIGFKTVMIENMHDIPYVRTLGPEVTAVMSIIGREIKKLGMFLGIQILAGGNREALAAASAGGLDFVRIEGYVFMHIGDEGIHESCAGDILRYRKYIGADPVLVFTDIKKKHSSHAVTSDITLKDAAEAAAFFKSDGVIVTGSSTGNAPDVHDLKEIQSVPIRKIVGSGLTVDNIEKFIHLADVFIVGSDLKVDGYWANDPDPRRARQMLQRFRTLK